VSGLSGRQAAQVAKKAAAKLEAAGDDQANIGDHAQLQICTLTTEQDDAG